MPARQIERALRVWRDAERILGTLDSTTGDAARARRAMLDAQSAYLSLVNASDVSADLLSRATEMIDEAEAELRSVEPRSTGATSSEILDLEPQGG